MENLIQIDKDNFEEEVINASETVILDFWGPSCMPCIALMPKVEELAVDYEGRVKFGKVNSAENRRLCISLKVMALPTFLSFKDGRETGRISGQAITIEDVRAFAVEAAQ